MSDALRSAQRDLNTGRERARARDADRRASHTAEEPSPNGKVAPGNAGDDESGVGVIVCRGAMYEGIAI